MYKNLLIATACLTSALYAENAKPNTVPAVKFWKGSTGTIDASSVAELDITTASPELAQLGKLFDQELGLTAERGTKITLTVDTKLAKNKEAYQLTITDNAVTITGASPAGHLLRHPHPAADALAVH